MAKDILAHLSWRRIKLHTCRHSHTHRHTRTHTHGTNVTSKSYLHNYSIKMDKLLFRWVRPLLYVLWLIFVFCHDFFLHFPLLPLLIAFVLSFLIFYPSLVLSILLSAVVLLFSIASSLFFYCYAGSSLFRFNFPFAAFNLCRPATPKNKKKLSTIIVWKMGLQMRVPILSISNKQ